LQYDNFTSEKGNGSTYTADGKSVHISSDAYARMIKSIRYFSLITRYLRVVLVEVQDWYLVL
jgi:hypothetical protein